MALTHSRTVQTQTIAVAQAAAVRDASFRTVFDPQLSANYDYAVRSDDDDETDRGDAQVRATGRVAGWTIEPFAGFNARPDTSEYNSGAGIAFSRQLLRWHEGLRQRIAVSRANRDLIRALNDRLLTLREVRRTVTREFLAVQRQLATLSIRQSRVIDAEDFLAEVIQKVENNLSAPVEQTNAELDVTELVPTCLRPRQVWNGPLIPC